MVPGSFTNGLLIPIPKKSGCDTSVPKNWRPIIISTTLSKLMEMYILEESSGHIFSDNKPSRYALVRSKIFAVLLSIDLPEHFYKLTEHDMIVIPIIPNR